MEYLAWGALLAISNLGGMYVEVPYTVVNPVSTPWERFLGSFQLTTTARSTFYAAKSLHRHVFPDIANGLHRNATMGLDDMLKQVMEQYVRERDLAGLCSSNIGNYGGNQLQPQFTIRNLILGESFDLKLDKDTVELGWTAVVMGLVIAICVPLIYCFTRNHVAKSTTKQKIAQLGNLLTKSDVVDLLRISRLSIAQEIKDDVSHDVDIINAKIVEVLDHLCHFEGGFKTTSLEDDSGETDDAAANKDAVEQTFNDRLQTCSDAASSVLVMLSQLKKRVDQRTKLQSQLPGEEIPDLPDDLYGFITMDDPDTSTLEKRIIEKLEEWLHKNIAGDMLKHTQPIDEDVLKRIENVESALAKVQQTISTDVVGKEHLDEFIAGVKEYIDNLRTSLPSLSNQGNGAQAEDIEGGVNMQIHGLDERLESLRNVVSMTPAEKERIAKDIDDLKQTLENLKQKYVEMESKVDSAITEEQLNKILEEKNALLKNDIKQMGDEVERLRNAFDKVKNTTDTLGTEVPVLTQTLKGIQNTIDESARKIKEFQKEHNDLRNAVQTDKTELENSLNRRTIDITSTIGGSLGKIGRLENDMLMQKKETREIWASLTKCMDSLGIQFGTGDFALDTPTRSKPLSNHQTEDEAPEDKELPDEQEHLDGHSQDSDYLVIQGETERSKSTDTTNGTETPSDTRTPTSGSRRPSSQSSAGAQSPSKKSTTSDRSFTRESSPESPSEGSQSQDNELLGQTF